MNNDLVRGIIVIFAITYVLTPFDWKDKRAVLLYILKFLVWTIVYFLVWATIHAWIETYYNHSFMLFVSEIVRITVFYVVYALFFCKYSTKTKVILTGSLLAAAVNADNLSNSFSKLYPSAEPYFCCFYLIILVFALVLKRHSVERVVDFPNGALFLIVMVNTVIVIFTIITALLSYVEERVVVYRIIIFAMQCVFVFPAYFSMLFVCKERDELLEERMKLQMVEAVETQVHLVKENLEVVRNIRHDLKNQNAYLLALLESGEYEKAKKMLSEQAADPSLAAGNAVDCGNFDISAILTMENSKANMNGYSLNCKVCVPKDLPIPRSDLCSVLTNLIDNAIEANARYGVEDPVDVQISCAQNMIYIKVMNKLGGNVDEKNLLLLHTSKADRMEHGLGTGIVKRVAGKHGGSASFSLEDNYFKAEVLLSMKNLAYCTGGA